MQRIYYQSTIYSSDEETGQSPMSIHKARDAACKQTEKKKDHTHADMHTYTYTHHTTIERSGAGPRRETVLHALATVIRGRRTRAAADRRTCLSKHVREGGTFNSNRPPAPWSPATAAKRGASRLPAPAPPAAVATSRRCAAAAEAPAGPSPASNLVRSRGTGGHHHDRCCRDIGQGARSPGSPSTRRSLPLLPLACRPRAAAARQTSPPTTVRPRSRTPSETRAPAPRPRSRRPWPLPPAGARRGRRRRGLERERDRDAPWRPPCSPAGRRRWLRRSCCCPPPSWPATTSSSSSPPPSARPCASPSPPRRPPWGWSFPWWTRPAAAPRQTNGPSRRRPEPGAGPTPLARPRRRRHEGWRRYQHHRGRIIGRRRRRGARRPSRTPPWTWSARSRSRGRRRRRGRWSRSSCGNLSWLLTSEWLSASD